MNIIQLLLEAVKENGEELPTFPGVSPKEMKDMETILSSYCEIGRVSLHAEGSLFGIPVEHAIQFNYGNADKEKLLGVLKALIRLSKAKT